LLRALETKRIQPLGARRELEVDVRIVAATHRDLLKAIAEGSFREDLYYRLNGVTLHVPALR
jgi:transcriptional regulator with PAS, ATPase and Fis domain